jgi:histidinol-phosphatase (PHP family)
MILVDYHMHSHVSHDATGAVAQHVHAAEKGGLAEICFTEHLDFYPSADGLSCATIPTQDQLLAYQEEVREARRHTRIGVKAGLEVDYKPEADRWVRDLLGRLRFDFLLGSVHNVGTWPVSGPVDLMLAYFEEKGAEQGCLEYLEVVDKAVSTGLFDSVAHLDLMKRFRTENGELMKRGRPRDRIVAILDLMAANGTGIEVNAAGLVHDPRETYPSLDLLKLARERGVERLTVGSDSHRPETVGRNLDAALSVARTAGFTRVYTFDQRTPTAHLL